MPTAKMSDRLSVCSIRTCSGDMYETFPFIVPAWVLVSRSSSVTRAIPKSRIFMPPWNESMRFDGETSRWTMPIG